MTIPLWVLLVFALWTLLVLVATVGVYRWSLILSGRRQIHELRHDAMRGHPDWYRRGMRAHGNCVETLPVYGAIVLVLHVLELESMRLDTLAVVLIVARLCQTLVHVGFVESNMTVSIRFGFFLVQLVAMVSMSVAIVRAAI